MLHSIMQSGNYNLLDLNKLQKDDAYKIVFPYHMTALALNKEGLKNMFKIVSEANTTYFHDVLVFQKKDWNIIVKDCYMGLAVIVQMFLKQL